MFNKSRGVNSTTRLAGMRSLAFLRRPGIDARRAHVAAAAPV